ncbi:MAG: N-6 DNA methylase [Candidatus Omnitrophica bacterium]|nr:N-6 DNA methylase [Candidatus Omnitrophota bacterium]
MTNEFTPQTIKYLKEAKMLHRKAKGQYFTPKTIRDYLLKELPRTIANPRVLDPGCGTGEFLLSAKEYFKNPELYGWDIDKKLVSITKQLVPEAKVKQVNALEEDLPGYFDFVIGNPPYYEFTPTDKIKKNYGDVISGRANIFGLFIKAGLRLLKEGGHLAFVLPPSMNNGAYFAGLRKLIVESSNIEHLKIMDNVKLFHGAQQMVMLLILKKGKNKGDYLFSHNGILIFSEDSKHLTQAFKGKTTLYDLGYSVKTGRLVWNQHKELLTDSSKEGLPLIWAHNIKDGKIDLSLSAKNKKKKQYVRVSGFDMGPAVVVNRITGAARSAKIRAAMIPANMKFIAENHCNVIYPPHKNNASQLRFDGNETVSLESILRQLTLPEKVSVMQRITGNTQISKTELERLFPIDPALRSSCFKKQKRMDP